MKKTNKAHPVRVSEQQLSRVSGGIVIRLEKTPSPGGPVPIPYPNISTAS